MNKKVAILIDGSNFYFKLKDLKIQDQLKLDFRKFSEFLANGMDVVDRKYYIGAVKTDGTKKVRKMHARQQALFSHLKKHSFSYRLGYLLKSNGKYQEKGVDIEIAVDMLAHTYENTVDTIILLSSDTDLIPAVRKAIQKGKHVEYIGFSHAPSIALVSECSSSRLLIESDLRQFIS
ncbi:MAG TPA: NYN domain-containing protein [bacterium]|nr:NYN domain-containing protein [bacterium]